ncbi:motility associated factor glycosyltransferase family protein [Clostridium malenominatum]|uniref:Motility associated factor glycosyltransferase family protein n=1 Tax=Clostridium malenominatum TaxID=1539 RepID=A0ABN1IZE2_9CLOT
MDNFTKDTMEYINDNNINEEYSLEKSKDDKYIIKINKDGKKIYLGSKYNVQRDIEEFLKGLEDITPQSIIIVFGLGAGEHIIELLKRLEESNKVLIIEPDINVVNRFLQIEYSKELISDERISLCLCEEDKVETFLNTYINSLTIRTSIKIIKFSNYDKIYRKEIINAFSSIKKFIEKSLVNNSTNKSFSELFTKAFVNNLYHIAEATPINYFKNIFKDKPAIVVSAGPSLEKNVHILKESQNEFIIITGARSLGTLIKNDIVPDFICMVDPCDLNLKFIEDYLDYNIPLVFFESTSYKALDLHKGEKIFFTGNTIIHNLLQYDVEDLLTGGSVAHTCTSFALHLGCNPITFIGQDFAYTGEKFHADSSAFRKENQINCSDEYIVVKDVYGYPVKTSWILNFYKNNMEEIIEKYKDKVFIDSTEGGAYMKATEVYTLKYTIDKYGIEQINKEKIREIFDRSARIGKYNILKYLQQSEKSLRDINIKVDRGFEYSKEIYLSYKIGKKIDIDNINKKLDIIGQFIEKNREETMIINFLIFKILEDVLCNPEYMISSKDSERERGIKIAEKSMKLYKGIGDKIKEVMPLLKIAIDKLKEEKE